MKKFILIVLGLVLLFFIGAATYVSMIDWNVHKNEIASRIENLTGKKVVFEGPLSMSLLPSPYLSASNVKVYNKEGTYSKKPLAEIKNMVAKLSLGSVMSGDFDVERMALSEPEINFELYAEGGLNWESDFTPEQEGNVRQLDISLDSVTLEKAKIHLVSKKNGIDATLENLNAEIIAESIFGPYRIEGSYTKDENPEGFAVSLGQFARNYATSVNLVVNYPVTQSYVRFDGSVFFKNNNVLGSVIFESENPANFVNETFSGMKIEEAYNQPLAVSAALNADNSKIDLSNVVVKYGKTSGAGNILIPLDEAETGAGFRPKVETVFNMTDLDLEPLVNALKKAVSGYRQGKVYRPRTGFDLIGDVKSLKTYYNGETIQDFTLSFDWVNNELALRTLSGKLLSDTMLQAKGSIKAEQEKPAYEFDVNFETGEFLQLAKWLGYELTPVAPATYQKASGKAKVSGNMQNMQLSPYEFKLDNMTFAGDAGFIFGENPAAFLIVNADSINFDNYISQLPPNEKEKSFAQRLAYRFRQLDGLRDKNLKLNLRMLLGIYDGVPIENTEFDFTLNNGTMDIERLQIANIFNASVSAAGKLSGFGGYPVAENLNYSVVAPDFAQLSGKLGIAVPDINLQVLKGLVAKGVLSGSPKKIAVNSVSKLENLEVNYQGIIDFGNGAAEYDGELEMKYPDFIKMLNSLKIDYSPRAFSLGLFALKGHLKGRADNFVLSNVEANAGANVLKGSIGFDRSSGRTMLSFDAEVNKLELERFLPEDKSQGKNSFKEVSQGSVDFLFKPYLEKEQINYMFLNKYDISGKMKVENLSYRDMKADKASFVLNVRNGTLQVSEFAAGYNGGKVAGNVSLNTGVEPVLQGKLTLTEQNIADGMWSGKKYGIRYGRFDADGTFSTSAASFDEMLNSLNAEINFLVQNPVVKGWNFTAITTDLEQRSTAEGLSELVQNNLQQGESNFETFSGKINIANGHYKFENAVFLSKDVKITMQDEGSLNNWDMNAAFEVFWQDKLAELPGFSFSLSGSMDSPQPGSDVSRITNLLETRQAQAEAARQAREQARKDKLKALMNEQQGVAQNLKKKIETQILPTYEIRIQEIEDEQTKAAFEGIKQKIDENQKQLEEIFTLAMTPEFDEKLIEDIAARNKKLNEEISLYVQNIDETYAGELKGRIARYSDEFQDLYQQGTVKNKDYLERYKQFPQRLIKAGSLLSINRNADVSRLKNSIDGSLIALNDMRYDVSKAYSSVKYSDDLSSMDVFASEMKNKLKDAKAELENMQKNIDELFKVSEQVVAAEEGKAAVKAEEAAKQKKVEDNTSTISVVSTGKVMKIVPDINQLEAAEKAVSDEKVKVLDFSKKGKVTRDGDKASDKKQAQPSSGMVVKQEAGKIPLSGTVTRD